MTKQAIPPIPKERRGELYIEYVPLSDLLGWPRNPKDHDVGMIQQSFQRFGFTDPVMVDERSLRLGHGHGRTKTLGGMKASGDAAPENIRVREADGEWLVPVVRGVYFKSDAEHEAYLVGSNQAVIAGGWLDDVLKEVLVSVGANTEQGLEGTGFDDDDLQALISNIDQAGSAEAPAMPKEPWVRVGDIFALGDHRLMCGDSSIPAQFHALTLGDKIDAIVTDPPYCSGGFQEADRIQGSIGTTKKDYSGQTVSIANDVLSTRGYKALIQNVLSVWGGKLAYIFTDWRMWTNLTDTMESQGYGIRSMIVWNKGTPGMGVGWRSQHELIACGSRVKAPFTHQEASGNVITCDRSGNQHHPTEKPIDLIKRILETTGIAQKVGEPFAGSGTTIIACEALGRTCYAMELSPYFAQVCIERWQTFTGKTAEKVTAGEGATTEHVHGARRVRPGSENRPTLKKGKKR